MKAKENAPLTTSSKVAVLFEVTPKKEYKETYLQLGAMLKSELTNMPGFISVERFLSLNEEGNYSASLLEMTKKQPPIGVIR